MKEIAEGACLWEGEGSEAMLKFRGYIKDNWFIVVTNTQLVERWVKDSNECTHSGKDDIFSSMIAICRSTTVFDYKEQAKAAARERILKGNQHMATGQIGTRTHKKSGKIELQEDSKLSSSSWTGGKLFEILVGNVSTPVIGQGRAKEKVWLQSDEAKEKKSSQSLLLM